MKKLQIYVLKDIFKALIAAFATLLLIMVVGFCMQLLHEGLDVVRLRGLLPPLFAYCVPMVLPSAFLTAVVMTFGRLSADNELVAVRAAGIHLFSIVYPVLIAAVLLTGVTMYFQFELVPLSRAAIKKLQYNAFKQMLLDKVVLSARRQFTFPPVFIQYEDFVDGKLTNLLLLKMGRRRPDVIIAAASAVVRTDQEEPEIVSFNMEDCVTTLFGHQTYGEVGTIRSRQAIYSVGIAPASSKVATDEKYLPTGDLLRRLRTLTERVSGQERLGRPSSVRKELRKELRQKSIEIADLNGTLQGLGDKYQKYAVQERQQNEQIIDNNRQRIEEAGQQLAVLRPQLLATVGQISRVRDGGAAHTDYDSLMEVEERRKKLQAQIEAQEEEIKKLKAEIGGARRALAANAERAAAIRQQTDVLQAQKDKLTAERRTLLRKAARAQDQHDLNSVWLRIHKKLAQAASLFTFALLGIPLGIMAGGRSTMVAFGISFAIVLLVFYPFLIAGQVAAKSGALSVAPAMWAGNLFVCLIGLALMLKVLPR